MPGVEARARARAPRADALSRGSAPLFWAQVGGNAGLFLAIVVIARALGPVGRGTVAFITVTAIVAAAVARVGVTEATTVFCASHPERRAALLSNLVLSVTTTAAIAAVVVCGSLELVPDLRPPGVGSGELAVLAGGMVATGLADAGYMFVLGCSRFRLHAAVTVGSSWLYAGTIVTLWQTAGLTVLRATLVWVAFQVAKAAVLLGVCARAERFGRPDRRLLRSSLAFGLRAWVGSLSTAFNERIDQILVALIASEAALGIYATAVSGFEILLYLAAAAATAMLPLVARTDPALQAERVLSAFRSVAAVTTIGIVAAAALGPTLLPLAFGAAFEASSEPFLWLLPGTLGFVALVMFSNALVASAAPGRSSAGPLVSLVLGLALDVALIPRFGASGAAAAASIGLLAGGATALALFRARSPFPASALLVPRRGDLALLRALARPFRRGS